MDLNHDSIWLVAWLPTDQMFYLSEEQSNYEWRRELGYEPLFPFNASYTVADALARAISNYGHAERELYCEYDEADEASNAYWRWVKACLLNVTGTIIGELLDKPFLELLRPRPVLKLRWQECGF